MMTGGGDGTDRAMPRHSRPRRAGFQVATAFSRQPTEPITASRLAERVQAIVNHLNESNPSPKGTQ